MSVYGIAGVTDHLEKHVITLDGNIKLSLIARVPAGEWYEQEFDELISVELPEGQLVEYKNERLREEVAEYFFYESRCAGQLFCHSMDFFQNTLSTYGNKGILRLQHRLDV